MQERMSSAMFPFTNMLFVFPQFFFFFFAFHGYGSMQITGIFDSRGHED